MLPLFSAIWLLPISGRYTSFDFDNFKHSLEAFDGLVRQFGSHPAVVAFQPVNEPWSHTPPNAYQLFVWTAYNMVSRLVRCTHVESCTLVTVKG